MTGYALVAATLAVCLCLGLLVLWFHSRRRYPPIKARFWWQPELISGASIFWAIHRSVSIELPGLGKAFYVLSYPLFFSICMAALIRLSHIYSAYKVADLHTELASAQNTTELKDKLSKGGFFVNYARIIQRPKTQGVVLSVHFLVQILIWVIVTFTASEFTDQAESGVAFTIVLFYGVPIVYIGAKIVPLNDGLYLRQEIIFLLFVGVVGGGVFVVARLFARNMIYVKICVLLLAPITFNLIFIGFPLYKSYVWQKEALRYEMIAGQIESFESDYSQTGLPAAIQPRPRVAGKPSFKKIKALEYAQGEKKGSNSVVRLSLKQVLANPHGVEAFKNFCKQELNHESILFFLEAKEFLEANKPSEMPQEQVVSRATQLYEKYVKSGAVLEINIDYGLKQNFVRAGLCTDKDIHEADINPELLEEAIRDARDEVFKLMAADSFVRFLRHRLYREFVNRVGQESKVQGLLSSEV